MLYECRHAFIGTTEPTFFSGGAHEGYKRKEVLPIPRHSVFYCLSATALVEVLIIPSLDESKSRSNLSPVPSTIPASFLQATIGFSLRHYLMSFSQVKF